MLFQIDKSISSTLSTEVIEARLRSLVKSTGAAIKSNHKFEGKITPTNFTLYPLFDYGPRNQFRPEIQGEIVPGLAHNQIDLKFRVSSNNKMFFFTILAFNIFISILALSFSFSLWWVNLVAIAIFVMITYFAFNLKSAESIRILLAALTASDKNQLDKSL